MNHESCHMKPTSVESFTPLPFSSLKFHIKYTFRRLPLDASTCLIFPYHIIFFIDWQFVRVIFLYYFLRTAAFLFFTHLIRL